MEPSAALKKFFYSEVAMLCGAQVKLREMVGERQEGQGLQASVMSEEAILEMGPPAPADTMWIRDKPPS